jgi:hypothetical protein
MGFGEQEPVLEPAFVVPHEHRRGDVDGRQSDIDQGGGSGPDRRSRRGYSRRELRVPMVTLGVKIACIFHQAQAGRAGWVFCMGGRILQGLAVAVADSCPDRAGTR